MHKFNVSILASVALFFASCGNQANSDKATVVEAQSVAEKQGETYALDVNSSKVNWKAYHKGGFAPRWGTLGIQSGEVTVAGQEITSGTFVIAMDSLWVDPASVTEADKKPEDLAAHLKNEDFFDTPKFPTAAFEVTGIMDFDSTANSSTIAGANKTISGNLTLLGNTINVTFPAKVSVVDGKAAVQANFTVDRAAWGIKFGTSEADPAEWMISKDIEIGLDVVAAS